MTTETITIELGAYDDLTIGELIDLKTANRDALSDAHAVVKGLTQAREVIDIAIMKRADREGTTRFATKEASVSVTETTVANVDDWDSLYQHILETKDFSLLQRRTSSAAYREALKVEPKIPGVSPRTVRNINLRSL